MIHLQETEVYGLVALQGGRQPGGTEIGSTIHQHLHLTVPAFTVSEVFTVLLRCSGLAIR